MVKRDKVLDMVSVDSIRTLEQADKILEACNSADGEVLEVYVNNAITRGAVYHKLTMVGEGELGLLRDEVATRYNIGGGTVSRYVSIFDNKNILLSKIKGIGPCMDADLKPTLASLLDTIKKDPDNVTKMIEFVVTNRGVSRETQETILNYMKEANEDIKYEFSKTRKVTLGALATAIKNNNHKLVVDLIARNGRTDYDFKDDLKKEDLWTEVKKLKKEIAELKEENEMLQRRNKFLVDSFKLSDVKRFLNRAVNNASKLQRYKPEMQEAMNILGVDATVDIDKLKKAYRNKVSIHHSDITGDDDMFRRIIEANNLVKEFIEGL